MSNFGELVGRFIELIDLLVILVFAVTLVVVIWYLTKSWILKGGDEMAVRTGRQVALASVIALVVMVSIWGILRLLQQSIFF